MHVRRQVLQLQRLLRINVEEQVMFFRQTDQSWHQMCNVGVDAADHSM
jgi:hypothetical protein